MKKIVVLRLEMTCEENEPPTGETIGEQVVSDLSEIGVAATFSVQEEREEA